MLRPPEGDSVQLASGLMFTGSFSMLVLMAVTGEWWAFEGSFGDGHWATLVAMANNALSFYLIFELIKRAGPVFFSMVNYVATLTGLGLGIWVFSDAHSIWIWAALVLIGASLVLVNFVSMRGQTSEHLTLTERFTRVDENILQYDVTIDDPTVWTQPWTFTVPMQKNEFPVYEYACHEGNYGLENILAGAIAED